MSDSFSPAAYQEAMYGDIGEEMARQVPVGLVAVAVVLLMAADRAGWPLAVTLLALALLYTQILALVAQRRSYGLAVSLIVGSSLALDLGALLWLRSSAVLCLFALPVSLSVLLVGSGLGVASAVAATAAILAATRLVPGLESTGLVSALLLVWALAGLTIGYRHAIRGATGALWDRYCHMSWELDGARNQRLELKQVQDDLVHANAELARLSDRLQHMVQVADDARRAKAEFVANVSHELRTPLNMVIGFCEVIAHSPESYGGLPPKLLADVRAVERNAQHLSSLIDDVLDISQIEANRMALSKEPASLGEIIESALQGIRGFFDSKGLYLLTDIPPDLPPLFCDPLRIRQVLLNLLSNAGRFTEQGGVRICVQREEQRLVVSVSDTGPGIAPEAQAKLFEPFRQVDGSLRRRHGGSGLGLTIGKHFVELHGGAMWLESTVGLGTTVSFALPLTDGTPTGQGDGGVARWFSPHFQYEARTRRSKAPALEPPPRFVVLESGRALQRLLRRYMGEAELVAAPDLAAAMQELSRSPARALLINAPWPRETLPPAEWPVAAPYDTPVIGCWVAGEEEAARELGVVRYLVKPVTRQALLASLEALDGQTRTVLLVDDEPEALQLYGRMLASAQRRYRILRAANGAEALDILRRRRPDAMVLDLMMPGMNGVELLREKGRDPDLQSIPVVVVSARDIAEEQLIGSTVVASRSQMSVEDMMRCICALSESLAPSLRRRDRAQSGTPGG